MIWFIVSLFANVKRLIFFTLNHHQDICCWLFGFMANLLCEFWIHHLSEK